MTTPTYIDGSIEYLTVTVTADVPLDAQPVAVSLDRGTTWLPCVWVGDPGTTRKARTTTPVTFDNAGAFRTPSVLVRVTDNPEVPIIRAGSLHIANH